MPNMSPPEYERPSYLMRIPPDVRMLIYEYILDANDGTRQIEIRHKPLSPSNPCRRTCYRISERSPRRRCHKSTYKVASGARKYTAIMSVSRHLYEETSWMLYSRHTFSFDADIEAVIPFLSDLTPATRGLIRSISVRKESPLRCGRQGDALDWSCMIRHIQGLRGLRRLKMTIEGDEPQPLSFSSGEETREHEPLRPLQVSDIRLLCYIKHDTLAWVGELAGFKGLESLEIRKDIRQIPVAETTEEILHASLSLSIDGALVDYLKSELGLAASAPQRQQKPPVLHVDTSKTEDHATELGNSQLLTPISA